MFGTFRHRREAALRVTKSVTKSVTIVMTICLALIIALSLIALRSDAQWGQATWYDLSGNYTASGDVLTPDSWTAAHLTFPFRTELTVCYPASGKCIHNVVVSDRGPAAYTGNSLDLHKAPADALGLTYAGVGAVRYRAEIAGHWDGVYVTPMGSGKWVNY